MFPERCAAPHTLSDVQRDVKSKKKKKNTYC